MNAQWVVPKGSRLWSAKGDENCSPPRSDDYKDWSLMQLKREITQRQLKTDPRRRSKDAFVRVLLAHDLEQVPRMYPTQAQQKLETSAMFASAPTSELHHMYANDGDPSEQQEQKDVYTTAAPQPQEQKDMYTTTASPQQRQQDMYRSNREQQQLQHNVFGSNIAQQQQQPELYSAEEQQQQRQELFMEPSHQQEVFTTATEPSHPFMANEMNARMMQSASLTPLRTQTSVVASSLSVPLDAEGKTLEKFAACKKPRIERTKHESAGSDKAHSARSDVGIAATATHQAGTDYSKRKLNIQVARIEIESRRLDIEVKREQRESELHAVQLALAKEQLHHAKLSSQKMKSEWMVERLIQKKRLTDAGISQEDSAALGMYLS